RIYMNKIIAAFDNKKAFIITYYNSYNYGAFLQAFALQEFLKSNNVDAFIWKFDSISAKVFGRVYSLLKPSKTTPEQLNYTRGKKESIISAQKYLNLRNRLEKSDLIILGSDEIWNVKNLGASHDYFMFKKQKLAKKTISYAACAGNTGEELLKKWPCAYKGIKSLDGVSVRDEKTLDIVKSFGRRDAVILIDPTFLIDFTKYLPYISISQPYLFVYSYGLKAEEILAIKKFAIENNLKTVATGCYSPWADENPTPDPFEWVALVKNSELVITSTFHGTALSIQQNVRFAVLNRSSHKIESLLNRFQLLNRMLTSETSLDYLASHDIDYKTINDQVHFEQKKSHEFIMKFL
ncbi:MAG: polysaccharide pyruvyl transferase family protein, partial [Lachnospiraceae bacterium]|nr:polysaccharide pyruvyl transferase family protein [Lachnospiraceae bacterium]